EVNVPEWNINGGKYDHRKLSKSFLQNILNILGIKVQAQEVGTFPVTLVNNLDTDYLYGQCVLSNPAGKTNTCNLSVTPGDYSIVSAGYVFTIDYNISDTGVITITSNTNNVPVIVDNEAHTLTIQGYTENFVNNLDEFIYGICVLSARTEGSNTCSAQMAPATYALNGAANVFTVNYTVGLDGLLSNITQTNLPAGQTATGEGTNTLTVGTPPGPSTCSITYDNKLTNEQVNNPETTDWISPQSSATMNLTPGDYRIATFVAWSYGAEPIADFTLNSDCTVTDTSGKDPLSSHTWLTYDGNQTFDIHGLQVNLKNSTTLDSFYSSTDWIAPGGSQSLNLMPVFADSWYKYGLIPWHSYFYGDDILDPFRFTIEDANKDGVAEIVPVENKNWINIEGNNVTAVGFSTSFINNRISDYYSFGPTKEDQGWWAGYYAGSELYAGTNYNQMLIPGYYNVYLPGSVYLFTFKLNQDGTLTNINAPDYVTIKDSTIIFNELVQATKTVYVNQLQDTEDLSISSVASGTIYPRVSPGQSATLDLPVGDYVITTYQMPYNVPNKVVHFTVNADYKIVSTSGQAVLPNWTSVKTTTNQNDTLSVDGYNEKFVNGLSSERVVIFHANGFNTSISVEQGTEKTARLTPGDYYIKTYLMPSNTENKTFYFTIEENTGVMTNTIGQDPIPGWTDVTTTTNPDDTMIFSEVTDTTPPTITNDQCEFDEKGQCSITVRTKDINITGRAEDEFGIGEMCSENPSCEPSITLNSSNNKYESLDGKIALSFDYNANILRATSVNTTISIDKVDYSNELSVEKLLKAQKLYVMVGDPKASEMFEYDMSVVVRDTGTEIILKKVCDTNQSGDGSLLYVTLVNGNGSTSAEVIVNEDGKFSFDLTLTEGLNTVYESAYDKNCNKTEVIKNITLVSDTDGDGVLDSEDQCPETPGINTPSEYVLEIKNFYSNIAGVTTAKVFLADGTEILKGTDDKYHVALNTGIIDDSISSSVPKGSWIIQRGKGKIIAGNYGDWFKTINSGYVYYKTVATLIGGGDIAVSNVKGSPFEHQGDKIAVKGNLSQDEFKVVGNTITAETTVRPDSDYYSVSISNSQDMHGCPFGDITNVDMHIIDQAKTGVCGYLPNGKPNPECKVPLAGVEVRIFDRDNSDFINAYKSKRPPKNNLNVIYEAGIGQVGSCVTDNKGQCFAGENHAGRFLVIAKYFDVQGNDTVYTGKFKNFKCDSKFQEEDDDDDNDVVSIKCGNNDGSDNQECRRVITKNLHIQKIIKKDGSIKYLAGMINIIWGSQLNIAYPDYTIWENDVEYYPITISSAEDWSIDLCLNVLDGYEIAGLQDAEGNILPINSCVQTALADESKVFLFTVKDIASPEPNFSFALNAERRENGVKVEEAKKVVSVGGVRSKTKITQDKELNKVIAPIIAKIEAEKKVELAQTYSPIIANKIEESLKLQRNIGLGNKGTDVKALQEYLNGSGFALSKSGVGSKGNETTYFGPFTKAAVIKYQKANGIKTTGFVGPITRGMLNK
ncbi:peptidoglycan-binding protein, partial [Patescibacteria group bacterium]|nr:peptidoglycan-binding protein [Patescibacteria group bacterium]